MMPVFNPDQFRKQIMEANLRQRAKDVAKQGKRERNSAENLDKQRPIFLRPGDVSGEYDFKRALKTTLGGFEFRDITLGDLQVFQKNIETIGAMFKGGITIPQIISLSRQEDIDRANREIHVAMPTSRKAGLVTFITNAGPKSKDPNHVVNIEFQAFDSVVLEPKKERASTIKNRLSNGKVKIECDCGRFTYWYRYIATVGNYVLGRKEGAFPKEKNPETTGVACKHILRVAQFCRSPLGQRYLEMAIRNDRTKQHGRRYSASSKKMAKMLDDQIEQRKTMHHTVKPVMAREVKKLTTRMNQQAAKVLANQSKLDEKQRRIARLQANYKNGLLDKQDFDFYMKVERERKY